MVELVIISLCTVAVTGMCSFLSAALSAISHNRLSELAEQGHSHAQTLLDYKRDIHTPKTALFITDVLIYTLGCISIGWYATLHFSSMEVGFFALPTTTVLLFFGHLLPRALGERFASRSIRFTVQGISFILLITKPLVQVVQRFYKAVVPPAYEESTREELDEILETAHEEGSLDAGEYRILKNIIRFSDVQVSDVMTPRTVVFSCDADTKIHEAITLPELRQYSRFPVCENDSLDSVTGYVLAKDVLWAMVNDKANCTLRDIAREVYFIPENIQLDQALENFLERREHLFVVVDEYGGVEGLLTMEDVMETLLGVEIMDEADKVTDLRHLAKQRRDQRIALLRLQNAHLDVTTTEMNTEEATEQPLTHIQESETIVEEDTHV